MKKLILLITFLSISVAANTKTSPILVNSDVLQILNLQSNLNSQDIVYFEATEKQLEEIRHQSHELNRCGGYELLNEDEGKNALIDLSTQRYNNHINFLHFNPASVNIAFNPDILSATEALNEKNLRDIVLELTDFKTRSSRNKSPNLHVDVMKKKVDDIISGSSLKITSELVNHSRTNQKTIKVRIEGSEKPNEIIILGGHLDSTSYFSNAPGADDNASGSSNILEVFRVLALQKQPKRSIELFWYAAEEIGLVGSSEIAKKYKADGIDVVAVMQLDMTGFAGSGVLNIGNITDFTSPWLQQMLVELNKHYAGAIIHESKCGYGCSDHASWFRQGYNTVFPIESKFKESNKNIHSSRDTIDKLSFEHSLVFAKLALSFTLELSNSDARGPQ